MIIETIFSTVDQTGRPNFAPMGVGWTDEFVTVRPFRDTRTYRNLAATGYGVANLTDDVLAYVQCGLYGVLLPCFPAEVAPGVVFQETCSWRELEVVSDGPPGPRAQVRCRVLHAGRRREFLGFCRGSNAVIEAAILATRLPLLGREAVSGSLAHFREIVDKTGDAGVRKAFELVEDFVRGESR